MGSGTASVPRQLLNPVVCAPGMVCGGPKESASIQLNRIFDNYFGRTSGGFAGEITQIISFLFR